MRSPVKAMVAVSALLLTLAFGATSAFGATGYTPTGTLDTSAAGALSAPERVAVDGASGDVLVVDSGNDRVAVFASDGSYLTDFGSAVLDEPFGIAVDQSNGDAYVSDAGNARLRRFTTDGAPTPTYTVDPTYVSPLSGSAPGKVGSFRAPLAVAPDGDLLLADREDNLIQRYDGSTDAFKSSFDGADTPAGKFTGLLDLAIDPSSGDVLVVDSTGGDIVQGAGVSRVEHFNPDGTYQATIGDAQSLPAPGLVTVDPHTGNTIVAANLQWFSGPSLYAYEGTEPVTHNEFDSSINGSAITGLAADPGATTTQVYAATDTVECCGLTSAQVFRPALLPTVTNDAVDPVGDRSATLNGTINPNGRATTYFFEYSADGGATWFPAPEDSGSTTAVPVDVGAGTTLVPVHQSLTGARIIASSARVPVLRPNTTYIVRLRATNAIGSSLVGGQSFTTAAPAPQVVASAAGPVSTTSAVLAGTVNPEGLSTTYSFQYGPADCASNPCTTVPATPQSAGTGTDRVFEAESVSGLEPGTKYHFRLLATNGTGSGVSDDRTFTTRTGALPTFPGRGYEKVSPDDKHGYDLSGSGVAAATPSGDRVVFQSTGALPGSPVGVGTDSLVATRGPSGWSSHSLYPPEPAVASNKLPNLLAFSFADPTKDVFTSKNALAPGATAGEAQLYLTDPSGPVQLLTPHPDENAFFAGSTPDFSHILYVSTVAQVPGAVGNYNLYEWVNGDLRLVGILPGGSAAPDGSFAGSAGYGGSGGAGSLDHVISADGRRVFFQTIDPSIPANGYKQGQLYVRDDQGTASTADDITDHVSASQRSVPDPAGPFPAFYQDAESAHGSKALFLSCEKLTDDSTAGRVGPTNAIGSCIGNWPTDHAADSPARDLYLYDADTHQLSDLTTADPAGADVFGVVGASDDLSHVYFVAQGVLASGASPSEPNLYLWDEGSTQFIATLAPSDSGFLGEKILDLVDRFNWTSAAVFQEEAEQVSSGGETLLFTSRARLTGYNNASPHCLTGSCSEVYSFDADTQQLSCLSCPPPPLQSIGDSQLLHESGGLADVLPRPRNIAEDGAIFFDSANALVPSDTNGVSDVYESRDGEPRLVSSGAGDSPAFFVDATPSGNDVYIITRRRLTSSDHDQLVDLYDARVGGGFAPPAPPPAPCSGDACQGPVSRAPVESVPSSTAQHGSGNQAQHRKHRKHRRRKHAKHPHSHRTGHIDRDLGGAK